ncbi:MAG: serpin family protein [Phycisphaerales bacterium]|jgi:serpin B|nr:serpin family protein [Phycisphaerales bacterium]
MTRKMILIALAACLLTGAVVYAGRGMSTKFAVRAPTPPLKNRVAAAETVFLGKVVNKVVTGEWATAELLVEESLRNAEKGKKTKVTWRIKLGNFHIYDVPEGSRGIAILKDKHKGRYWLRSDKFEKPNKLAEVKGLIGPVPANASKNASAATLVKGNTDFALKLYHQLSANEGNLFFSPHSISSALGMTYAGARGQTEKEMKAALSFELEQAKLHAEFKKLNAELASNARDAGQKLNIANALCLTNGDVSKDFEALLKGSYDAEIFAGGLDRINGWVKKKTEGKIAKILDNLSANSVCVILNAIYFKGAWVSEFDKEHTRELPFKVSATKQVKTPLMYQKGKFKLLRKMGLQIAALPYKGKAQSMVVLLPEAVDGIGDLQKQLTALNLSLWLGELDKAREQTVQLHLPRFKLETSYDLVAPFKKLGMKNAFDTQADFSGMGWKKGELLIGQIKHKAFIEVNEEGTEAAAATAVEMVTKSARRYPRFRADHPFIYLIRDNKTGSILFVGRMSNPK